MKAAVRTVTDTEVQGALDDLLKALNMLLQFFYFGNGVPTLTPPGRAIYIRLNGGTGSTLYYWNGAAWVALP